MGKILFHNLFLFFAIPHNFYPQRILQLDTFFIIPEFQPDITNHSQMLFNDDYICLKDSTIKFFDSKNNRIFIKNLYNNIASFYPVDIEKDDGIHSKTVTFGNDSFIVHMKEKVFLFVYDKNSKQYRKEKIISVNQQFRHIHYYSGNLYLYNVYGYHPLDRKSIRCGVMKLSLSDGKTEIHHLPFDWFGCTYVKISNMTYISFYKNHFLLSMGTMYKIYFYNNLFQKTDSLYLNDPEKFIAVREKPKEARKNGEIDFASVHAFMKKYSRIWGVHYLNDTTVYVLYSLPAQGKIKGDFVFIQHVWRKEKGKWELKDEFSLNLDLEKIQSYSDIKPSGEMYLKKENAWFVLSHNIKKFISQEVICFMVFMNTNKGFLNKSFNEYIKVDDIKEVKPVLFIFRCKK